MTGFRALPPARKVWALIDIPARGEITDDHAMEYLRYRLRTSGTWLEAEFAHFDEDEIGLPHLGTNLWRITGTRRLDPALSERDLIIRIGFDLRVPWVHVVSDVSQDDFERRFLDWFSDQHEHARLLDLADFKAADERRAREMGR